MNEIISMAAALKLAPYPSGAWDLRERLRKGICPFGYARQDPVTGIWKYFIFKELYVRLYGKEKKEDEKQDRE